MCRFGVILFKVLNGLKHQFLSPLIPQDAVCICSYYVSWKAFANWRFFVYFTAQFIASVLDIPNFNLLCERVPYVRDDPRLTRVGNFLGTETRIIWNLTVTVS